MYFCDFGKEVKKKLIDINQSQSWLMHQVNEKTGLYIDSGYLYKILSGTRNAPKIKDAICEILNISGENQNTS